MHVRDIVLAIKIVTPSDGGLYKWEAAFGEGRATALIELYEETNDREFLKLRRSSKIFRKKEIVGRFLSENILRQDHSWLDQARS